MKEKTIHVTITGNVQGVGFRWFTKQEADKRAIQGTVQNMPDGSVEAVFQGDEPALEDCIAAVRSGPSHARVDDVRVKTVESPSRYDSFSITH